MNFKDQVAIITGAGSENGIGRETARQLSKGGATVVLTDIDDTHLDDAVKEMKNLGGHAISMKVDVSNQEQAANCVKETVNQFGKVDILVNNAGISRPSSILDITEKEWDLVFNVNMKGVFFLTQAVLPYMKEKNYGRILNLSSVSGKRGGGIFGGSHYSAAKAGVTGFSKAVAREFGPYGITCNTVAPGLIGGTEITGDQLTDEKKKQIIAGIPLGRVGEVKDVAHSITFLVSEPAGYITGEELDINGGSHID
ncbi:short chain dehydrogenase [Gracilibacillus halophilus YIM-C55.5]|uniref:Short chain dehydrogenase n=1 Tax=Gracilibacillus halophilus YIM-C55.5 TaxID=1308866 RepID=N4W7C4_9BACI|nr:SDR family NAD(P)-dependent oxidoreductase [Gracilibacillus halophilus]ENH96148.1 short chain dehydrogenase [Gracilibacillus halophilus YIM-C55.5]